MLRSFDLSKIIGRRSFLYGMGSIATVMLLGKTPTVAQGFRTRSRDIGDIHNDTLDCLLEWLQQNGVPNPSTLPTVPVAECYKKVTGITDEKEISLVDDIARGVLNAASRDIEAGKPPLVEMEQNLINGEPVRLFTSERLQSSEVKITEQQRSYVKEMSRILKEGGRPDDVAQKIERIERQANQRISDPIEKKVIVNSGIIGKKSYHYWNKHFRTWAIATGKNPENADIGSAANGDEVGAVIGGAAGCVSCWTGCLACIEGGALGGAIAGSFIWGVFGEDD